MSGEGQTLGGCMGVWVEGGWGGGFQANGSKLLQRGLDEGLNRKPADDIGRENRASSMGT